MIDDCIEDIHWNVSPAKDSSAQSYVDLESHVEQHIDELPKFAEYL